MTNVDPVIKVTDVIRDLQLAAYVEDWGLIASDPDRLAEFVEYFVKRHAGMDDECRGEMLDLVLASAEEALRDGADPSAVAGDVERMMAAGAPGPLWDLLLDYWIGYLSPWPAWAPLLEVLSRHRRSPTKGTGGTTGTHLT